MGVAAFHRTLAQELTALARGISLECLVCGEFVLHEGASIRCPECGATVLGAIESAGTQLHLGMQAG